MTAMNQDEFLRSGRRLGVMYFDDTTEGRYSREHVDVRAPATAALRAKLESDRIKARARRLARK